MHVLQFWHIGFLNFPISIFLHCIFFGTIYKILCNVTQKRNIYKTSICYFSFYAHLTYNFISCTFTKTTLKFLGIHLQSFNSTMQLHMLDKYMQIVLVLSFRNLVFQRLFHLIAYWIEGFATFISENRM